MLEKILNAVSRETLVEDTRYLAEECPMRLAGSEMERKAASYIEKRFNEIGVPITLHELDGYVSFPHSARLEVLSPEHRVIEANAFAQAQPTPPDGLEADIVFVGAGGLDDYEGVEAEGKITLAELSYAPPRPEKVRIATEKGAIGQIMMNWGLPEHGTVPMGTCKPVWGNPTPATVGTMPQIPAIGISRADGNWLAELAARGPVKVRIHCDTENRWGKIVQPVARIEGTEEAENFVLVAGHYDAWAEGATDNATGNAVMIEMARILNENRDKLRRSVVFSFWAAHESGIMEGSSWFVDRFWDDLRSNCVATMNIDSQGMVDATELRCDAAPELSDFAADMAKEVLGIDDAHPRPLSRTGDQSFFGIGIPSMYLANQHPKAMQELWRGATLGWWYHSVKDTMEVVDPEILERGARVNLGAAFELARRPVLPMNHAVTAERIAARLEALSGYDVGIDLAGLAERAGRLGGRIDALVSLRDGAAHANDPETTHLCNAAMMRLSRTLTPMTGTVAGSWEQDTYGLSSLKTVLPGLFEVPAMAAAGPDSDYFKLQWTQTVRQRNRAADTLDSAIELIDGVLARVAADKAA
ncbi:M20/M25/M40 family metallo-hydrolase [Salipiger mucosus]|uniref:Peptidase M28 domain-containing protein n=1 Tax=Salipiger mucosus DSM 16094 TaxID=1123237 RepID=S9QKP0_9RHOB|nr:M20/M25/M40 family metallo-hydrolase [Salipiger mucosus]EPX80362.1 hypothetical protein Salmuc_03678 [Salipiger mucosus DSM 16094]